MLFASLPLDAKVTPEQVLDQRARIAKPPWPMWSYGKRGDMIRDLHWPVRNAEGKLVSKEVVSYNASGYVHAHLLHAYIGNSQDVVPEQIECRNYRRRCALSPARRARGATSALIGPPAPILLRAGTRSLCSRATGRCQSVRQTENHQSPYASVPNVDCASSLHQGKGASKDQRERTRARSERDARVRVCYLSGSTVSWSCVCCQRVDVTLLPRRRVCVVQVVRVCLQPAVTSVLRGSVGSF